MFSQNSYKRIDSMINNVSDRRRKRNKVIKKTISNQTAKLPLQNPPYSSTPTRKRQSVEVNTIVNDILQNDSEDLLSDINFLDEINH